jgi:hypothetical protein
MTAIDANAIRTPRRFYVAMAITIAIIVFIGFAPSYYLKSVFEAPPPLSALTSLHGVVFTAWLALFIAQTSLVARNRTDLHMKLGIAGAVLATVIVVLGAYTGIVAGKLGHAPPGAPPPIPFMAVPLFGIVAFGGFIAAALLNRHRPETHKRLMVVASVQMTEPAFGRIAPMLGLADINVFVAFGGADLLLLAAMAYDYTTTKRVHPAYIWGLAITLAVQVITFLAVGMEAWASIATWLTTLV